MADPNKIAIRGEFCENVICGVAGVNRQSLLKPSALRVGEGEGTMNVEELLAKARKPSADAMTLHPFYRGKVEIALIPRSNMVKDLVELDERGRIIVDCANCTNVPALFAAGDVTNSYAEQVLIAVGEGAKAALSAYEYLLPMLAITPVV
jgi:alkyl hydroperoxide reductase subunit AhpF